MSPDFDSYLAAQVEEHVNPRPDADDDQSPDYDDEPEICGRWWSPG